MKVCIYLSMKISNKEPNFIHKWCMIHGINIKSATLFSISDEIYLYIDTISHHVSVKGFSSRYTWMKSSRRPDQD